MQNFHLCAQKSVCATNLGPFGEIGANFSLQLSLRTRFDKFNEKKVIAENQCEKHKKSSLHAWEVQGFFLSLIFGRISAPSQLKNRQKLPKIVYIIPYFLVLYFFENLMKI